MAMPMQSNVLYCIYLKEIHINQCTLEKISNRQYLYCKQQKLQQQQ